MAYKVLSLTLLISCLASAQNLEHHRNLQRAHHEHSHQDEHHRPEYRYSYGVDDVLTGDSKTQAEERIGDSVRGSYSLTESDGSRRLVEYEVEPHTGFNAVVTHHGAQEAPQVHRHIPSTYSTPTRRIHNTLSRQGDYDTEVVESVEQFPSGQQPAEQPEFPQPSPPQTVYPQPISPQPVAPQPQPIGSQPIYPQPQPIGSQPIYPQPQPIGSPIFPQPQPIGPQPIVPQPQPSQQGGLYPAGTQPLSPTSRMNHFLAYNPVYQRLVGATSGMLSQSAHHVNTVHHTPEVIMRTAIPSHDADHISQVASRNAVNLQNSHFSLNRHPNAVNPGYSFAYDFSISEDPNAQRPHNMPENHINSDYIVSNGFAYSRENDNLMNSLNNMRSSVSNRRPAQTYLTENGGIYRSRSGQQTHTSTANNRHGYESLAATFGHQASRLVTGANNHIQENRRVNQNVPVSSASAQGRNYNRSGAQSDSGQNLRNHITVQPASNEHHDQSVVLVTPSPFAYTPLVHPFELVA